MNKIFPGILVAATMAFASCGNPPANSDVSATQPVTMPESAPAPVQNTAAPSNIIQMEQPASVNSQGAQPQVIMPQQVPQQTASTKPGGALNPEHGKPGHRCDIAVGAPLNSPASATPQTQQSKTITTNSGIPAQQVGPQITPIQAAPSASTGRVNPAHGEPGHDCAKPVGAPLN